MRSMAAGRVVEGYVGEYASGKSELAVNRAVDLFNSGHPRVTLVDFDLVEPCYTLRPLKKKLSKLGISVLAWDTRDTIGLGETGNILRAENRWALRRAGDVILDIGYGVEGARTLNLLEGAREEAGLQVLAVVNIARPMTSCVKDIVDYVHGLGMVHGLINNSHLGDDTDLRIIRDGAIIVSEAARLLQLPVVATTVLKKFALELGQVDAAGNPVRVLSERYMLESFW